MMQIGHGDFTPGPPHIMRGSFTLTRQEGRIWMATSANFFFDGSPEPAFALHKGLPTDKDDPVLRGNMEATRFLDLPRNEPAEGRFDGPLRPETNIDDFNTIVLWCFQIPFILGYGPIEPG